jgi:hypothetical protein
MKTLYKATKKISIALMAIVLVSAASSCKKFLDTEKQGSYTDETYPYPGGSGPYDQYIFAAYNNLRAYGVHAFGFVLATSVRSDDADIGSSSGDGGANVQTFETFPLSPANGIINGMWVEYYSLIDKCNIVLDQVENNKDIIATDANKMQSQAEARFMRAYAYFNMVRLFGNIPLIDKKIVVGQNTAQSKPDEIYPFIESDLQFAAANLPPSWEPKFVGRITSGAANGLLAKVYLTQKKWAAAMGAANIVMSSGQYNLSTPYDTIFGEEGENSKESVFEVQATATAAVPRNNGVQYAAVQGVRGGGPEMWNLGDGFNVPGTTLDAAYETGDPRKARTFLYRNTAQTLASPTPYRSVYGDVTGTTWVNPIYNHKVYTNPAKRATIGDRFGWWMNIRILRYADVVLMYAEAANEVGGTVNTTAALAALNSVRFRARNGSTTILPNVTTTDQGLLRNAIRQERRVELAMENDRFFDLVRWGIAGTAMAAAGRPGFVEARDVLLPIPQTQIDLSKGVLKPNFGY